jgi:xylulokinase
MTKKRSCIISVDCGTQSSRAIVWDTEGHVLSQGSCELEVLSPHPGWSEQRAESWWEATCIAIKKAISEIDLNTIAAMGITHQRETFVPVASNGKPLMNAILHLDQRSSDEVDFAQQKIGADKIQQITGKVPCHIPSCYKIAWIMNKEPQISQKVHKYLDVQSYLLGHLIQRYVTSYVSADSFSLINIKSRTWDPDLMNHFHLREEQLPELCPPGQIVGRITKKASAETNLPEGLPVVSGAGDGICATLGTNVVKENQALLYVGTWTVLGIYSPNYVVNKAFRTLCGCIPNSYILEGNVAGGYLIKWFIDRFQSSNPTDPRVTPEEILETAAVKITPGANGLMTIPYWAGGSLAPYWDPLARGVMLGWSGVHSKAHFYRSILEGITFEHRLLIDNMTDCLNTKVNTLIFIGGGAKSRLWGQIIADIMGVPVSTSETIESTALGAAILAAAGAGIYPSIAEASNNMTKISVKYRPNEGNQRLYNQLYNQVYKGLYPKMQASINHLAEITKDSPEGDENG